MSETYSVVVTGQLLEGFTLDQVRENLGQGFKLNDSQLDKLLCGRPVALKRGVDSRTAAKLSERLQSMGAQAIIKASAPASTEPTSAPSPEPEPAAPQQTAVEPEAAAVQETVAVAEPEAAAMPQAADDESIDCPRCAHSQKGGDSCELCNMDLTMHRRRQAKRRRVVASILAERGA